MKRQSLPARTILTVVITSLIAGLYATTAPSAATEIMSLAWDYTGSETGGELGYAVNTAGDVNGDDYADIIIGVPHGKHTVDREGVAYLFHGGPNGPGRLAANQTIGSGEKGAELGYAVNTAGDVNGDGYADVIVGSPSFKNDTTQAGAVFVHYGSSGGVGVAPDWHIVSEVNGAKLGISVSTAGDVNGDGFDDVIIGASDYLSGTVLHGAAFIFFGSTTGLTDTARQILTGTQANARFGFAVSAAGDVNGDGFDDVIIGSPHYDNPEVADAGAIFLFYGSATGLNTNAPWTFIGNEVDLSLGADVSAAGDVNGDGFADVVIGSAPADPITQASVVLGFYGSAAGLGDIPHWQKTGSENGSGFGRSVANAGDVNNDGFDDVLVGAYRHTDDQREEGAAYIFFGSTIGLNQIAGWQTEGDKAETFYGYAIGAGGDTNRDGYADVIIGAPQYKVDDKDVRGRAFVYLGAEYAGAEAMYWVYLPVVIKND